MAFLGAMILASTSLGVSNLTVVKPVPVASPQVLRTMEVRVSFQVENKSDKDATDMVLVVPPYVLNKSGTQKVVDVTYNPAPTSVVETSSGKEATYKFATVTGRQVIQIEQIYKVEISPGFGAIQPDASDPAYLEAALWIETDHPQIRAEAIRVTSGLATPTEKAVAVQQFIADYLTYNLEASSRNQGGLAGYNTKEGTCTEYAGLFTAMMRVAGVPTRLVFGWATTDGFEKGQLSHELRHVWVEYFDGAKWVPKDPTYFDAVVVPGGYQFDIRSHLAQSWAEKSVSLSYKGRGFLTMKQTSTLVDVASSNGSNTP